MALAHQRAQRAQQRRVRQLAVGLLDALAAQHERRSVLVGSREPLLELADEPRLADARVTAEQDEAGPAGAGLPDGEQ